MAEQTPTTEPGAISPAERTSPIRRIQAAEPPATTEPPAAALPPAAPAAPAERTPGWREVLIVAAVVVAVVLGASFITGFLPTAGQDFVFKTPLAIVVIVVGTVGLLARLARRPPVA